MANVVKEFLSFLKENDCVKEYFDNAPVDTFIYLLNTPYKLFVNAFVYQDTPQGDSYWRSLAKTWTGRCEVNKYEVPEEIILKAYEDLFTFLKDKGALDKYIINCEENKLYGFKVLEGTPKRITEFISLAFDWSSSPEEYDYWVKLSREWNDYIVKKRGEKGVTMPTQTDTDEDENTDKKPSEAEVEEEPIKIKSYRFRTKIEYTAQVIADTPLNDAQIAHIEEWLVDNFPDTQDFEIRTDKQAVIGFKEVEVYEYIGD